jgi:hypothetical protein
LTRDEYAAYDSVVRAVPGRIAAGCLAHARRKYDRLLRDGGKSAVAAKAIRIAAIYHLERELAPCPSRISADRFPPYTRARSVSGAGHWETGCAKVFPMHL